jgi:hypothetical protein
MFRVSLREMFLLVAATALAIVSLLTASFLWQSIIGLAAMLAAMIAMIVTFVDCGPRRAFAIGFAVAMLGYLFVVLNAREIMPANRFGSDNRNVEFGVYEYGARLPTSVALQYIYAGISRTKYFDAKTGERIPESESAKLSLVGEWFGGVGGGGLGGGGFGGMQMNVPAGQRPAFYETRPRAENFMVLGHFWWALLFGYVGGHFARFVYLRRDRETKGVSS